MLQKAHGIGRQIALLPDRVVNLQSEIENFPYQQLKKARRTVALEVATYIAAGCTGAAFNVLPCFGEPFTEYEELMATIQRHRRFYDLMVREGGRAGLQGLYSGWNCESYVTDGLDGDSWPRGTPWSCAAGHAAELWESGLPAAYRQDAAAVTLLGGDRVMALSHEEIMTALAGGIYMDAPALERLNQRGYGEYTGFTVAGYQKSDCMEELLPHPFNGVFAGRCRDGRQSFTWWGVDAARLTVADPGAIPLARLIDYAGQEVANCCAGYFENRLGGRVIVAGYYPWTFLQSNVKTLQLRQWMRYLSKDTLPAYIATPHKIALWVKAPRPDHLTIALLNTCLDDAVNAELSLLTDKNEITVIDMDCRETLVCNSGGEGNYRRFVLPPITGWDMRWIRCYTALG